MLTTSSEEQDLIDTYRLEVSSYIVKPVDFGKFSFSAKHLGNLWLILNRKPLFEGGKLPETSAVCVSI